MSDAAPIGIIAGKGVYPEMFIGAAKQQVPHAKLVAACFHGETFDSVAAQVTVAEWFRVGQLGKVIKFFRKQEVTRCIMIGQIAPRNLFDLIPDVRTVKMLAKLKKKNADTLFKAVADELHKDGIEVMKATTYLDEFIAVNGHISGPKLKSKFASDVEYGFYIAKQTSELDIGQSVVVKDGTVLAVEAFEGTNACLKRGGQQGRGKGCVLAKVSKPNHDFRFDVPCIGVQTIRNCSEAGIEVIVCESGKTLLLDKGGVESACNALGVTLIGAV